MLVPAPVPVTIPEVDIVATEVLDDNHTPPVTPEDNVVVAVAHNENVPEMTGAAGVGFTVNVFVAVAAPQAFITIYTTVSMPGETPVTMPPPPMLAVLLVTPHMPPATLLVIVVVLPTHISVAPLITPASGSVFTVSTRLVVHPVANV